MRGLFKLLFILALTARSLLPAGFMLQASATGSGGPEIVICTGHGPQTITLDRDGKPIPPAPIKGDAGLCPYAASAPVATAAPIPVVTPRPPRLVAAVYARASASFRAEPNPGGTSARGPPHVQA